jgi:hypothetical protein
MRKFFLAFTLSLAFASLAHAGDFAEGWRRGYIEGWKHVRGSYSFEPFVPFTPFPPLGCNSYTDGFTAGVIQGAREAENQ